MRDAAVTELLVRWGQGDAAARDLVVPLVYQQLRRIAGACMAGERNGHVLQATALVNEAYIRLATGAATAWRDRGHFLAVAARIMRRVLVDHARARRAAKRGGRGEPLGADDVATPVAGGHIDMVAIDDALAALATLDPRKGQVVELRFFGGLSVEETAKALHVSPDTVVRDWRLARAWLQRELRGRPGGQ